MTPLVERTVFGTARVTSGLLTALGVVALLRTHFNGFADTDGVHFLSFTVNPLMNLIHLGAGLVGIAMALTLERARRYLLVLGAVGVPFALLEFVLGDGSADIFARDDGLATLHLLVALAALGAWAWSRATDHSQAAPTTG